MHDRQPCRVRDLPRADARWCWADNHTAVLTEKTSVSAAGRQARQAGRPQGGWAPILVAVFHVLAGGVPYQDLGADHFRQLTSPQRRARRHLNDLKALGWTVTDPDGHLTLHPPQAA